MGCGKSKAEEVIEMDHYTGFHSFRHPRPTSKNECDTRFQEVEGEFATFGCGNFHDAAAKFALIPGVIRIRVGYSCGKVKLKSPIKSKEDHAEVVDIEFDPFQLKYEHLLEVFWMSHDPAIKGTKHPHSKILYHSNEQKAAADEALKLHYLEVHNKNPDDDENDTDISPARHVFPANKEDQQFYLQRDKFLSKHVNCSTTDELQYSHLACKLNGLCSEWVTLRDLNEAKDELQLSQEVEEHLKKKIMVRRTSL